jgi:hypothetical protein
MVATVVTTPTTTWAGLGRRTVIVVSGFLWGSSIPEVIGPVRAAVDAGADRVVVDVSVLARGDRGSLLALAALRGRDAERPGCLVDVSGVRWEPFRDALRQVAAPEFDRLCTVLGELSRPMTGGWLPVTDRRAAEQVTPEGVD